MARRAALAVLEPNSKEIIMKRAGLFVFSAVVCLCATGSAFAQVESTPPAAKEISPLHIGDEARPLSIEHWVKGEPVKEFKKGNVYVVEFWATWCGPCKASMPHLSESQTKYRDYNVTIIGISDEPLEKVTQFMGKEQSPGASWDSVISYTLTTDPDRSNHDAYMRAVGATGIPTAFIIGKDSKLEWVGNPHPKSPDGFDKALEAVVKDEWDRAAFAKEFEAKAQQNRERTAKVNAMRPLQQALQEAIVNKDYEAGMKACDGLIELDPENSNLRVAKFNAMLRDFNKPTEAYAYGEELVKDNWENPEVLNAIAWFVVDAKGVQTRDLDFAMRAAVQANDLSKEENAAILDTLARVYFEKGEVKTAVRIQRKAVEKADDAMKPELQEALKRYEERLSN
jgi:thiol-disulfide isomerase/thioredoxin